MKLVDFTSEQIGAAAALAAAGYEDERRLVPALPEGLRGLSLEPFAENGLGVAAWEAGELVGFLCATKPFENAFGSTAVRGVFAPMGAHGTVRNNRAAIYAALYQEAARKWVRAGAVSHGIALYAHDEAAQRQFYQYGFGLRCVDAIREMKESSGVFSEGYQFSELAPEEFMLVYPLEEGINRHFRQSPCFMNRSMETPEEFYEAAIQSHDRFFGAWRGGRLCAHMRVTDAGETWISEDPLYWHINGAFCQEEYRGSGVSAGLLNWMMQRLREEGAVRLGVDFESINPAANGFWLKNFTAYTHGVVRRIDERILS